MPCPCTPACTCYVFFLLFDKYSLYIFRRLNNATCRFDFEDLNKTIRAAYTFCGVFSLIFLIITMFVYMTLPSLQNLHGKIVISNVASVLLTTKLLIIIYNVQKKDHFEGQEGLIRGEFLILVPSYLCLGLGYGLYYTGISMFCWMSIMCIGKSNF